MSAPLHAGLITLLLLVGSLAAPVDSAHSATCGDGACETSETPASCDIDCHYACGDALCGCGETHSNCQADCPDATCGSGFCEAPETAATCSDDCAYDCGDGTCGPDEDFGNCEVDCPASTCGNGTCDAWEDALDCPTDCIDNCGDGYCSNSAAEGFENGSQCPADCPSISCGDGFCTNGEAHQTCAVDCPSPQCGDAQCGAGEDCYSCETDCGVCTPLCGDGLQQGSEACDDGDTTSGDGCSDVCVVEDCGDGLTHPALGEQCDDANNVPDDGCTASCKNEYCGDIFTQPGIGEVCDGSSTLCSAAGGYPGTQACKADCTGYEAACVTRLYCGDGICTFPPESADPADAGYCPQDCAPPIAECVSFGGQPHCQSACGDGIVSGSESCDDGNADSLDGCSAECQPDTPPALPLVDLGAINAGDFDGNGQWNGSDLQAALDTSCGSGCILELPAVEYLDVAVTVPPSITAGLVIRGQGIDATVLKAPIPQVTNMFSVESTNAFTVFQRMTLDGRKQLQPTYDIGVSPSGIKVGWGAVANAGPGRVEHVKLRDHVRLGVAIRNSPNWTFNHNIAHDIGCADDTPCDLIDVPYLDQSVYPQIKMNGWGIVYIVPAPPSGAIAHHNTLWHIKKIGIEAAGIIFDYEWTNNFFFASRGAIVSNSGGGLRGLVSHNYIETTQDEAIQTRTGATTIHNNVIVDNYGIGIVATSPDHDLVVSDNVLEHECKRWGTNSFTVSREGSTGDGAVVTNNDLQLGDDCSNPVLIRRSNTRIEDNVFSGGRPDQWVLMLLDSCDVEIKRSTLVGSPSTFGLLVNSGVANVQATQDVDSLDVTTPYVLHGAVDPVRDHIDISMNDDYEEANQGDLSGDYLSPTPLLFAAGSNAVTASQQGDAHGRDVDYLTFTVPSGMLLASITLQHYSGVSAGTAFVGLQSGSSFSVDADTAQASDLLGGAFYGAADVGDDLLPGAGALAGASGFSPPLFAGDYTFWLNQTGDPSTATLDFVLAAQPTGPEIEVRGQGQAIADGDATPSAGDGTHFGETPVGGPGAARSYSVRNLGSTPLNLAAVGISGSDASDFTVSGFAPGALAPSGGTTSFLVTFAPAAPGPRSATLSIASDDADETSFDFAIAGGAGPTAIPALPGYLGAGALVMLLLCLGAVRAGVRHTRSGARPR